MYHRRFLGVALTVLIVIGLLIAGGSAIQRGAWTEGYMIGRLSAGGDDGTVIPYAPYGFGYPTRHFGFAPFLCTAGLFVLLLVMAGKFFRFWAWKQAGGPEGEEWTKHWAKHWRGHHGPPWCWGEKEPAEKAKAAEPEAEIDEAES